MAVERKDSNNAGEGAGVSPLLIPYPGMLSPEQTAMLLKVQTGIVDGRWSPANNFIAALRNGEDSSLDRALQANIFNLNLSPEAIRLRDLQILEAVYLREVSRVSDISSASLPEKLVLFVDKLRRVTRGSIQSPKYFDRWRQGVAVYAVASHLNQVDVPRVRQGVADIIDKLLDQNGENSLIVQEIRALIEGISDPTQYDTQLKALITRYVSGPQGPSHPFGMVA